MPLSDQICGSQGSSAILKVDRLEQFNDVLPQENVSVHDTSSPLFDLNVLNSIPNEGSFSVEAVKRGWYRNVVYLGKENDIPALTMTCPL
ncbi:hypothetical protein CRYUN_Cryun07bG0037200 [Craigia yunnanensis]